jgi:hypothetical protein
MASGTERWSIPRVPFGLSPARVRYANYNHSRMMIVVHYSTCAPAVVSCSGLGRNVVPGTTNVSPTGNQDTDGVLIGTRWDTLNLTFSFPTSASFYGTSYGGEPSSGFKPLNAMQMTAARETFAMISALTNLTFTEVTESATIHADLRHASSDLPGTAWAYYPSSSPSGGDAWYNGNGTYDVPILGSYAYFTFMHEIGHSLGLKHGQEASVYGPMTPAHDSHEYSLMTYRSYVGSPGQFYTNETWAARSPS